MILRRLFAVIAAVMFVAAFALAALLPLDSTLAEALAGVDHRVLVWLPQHAPGWAWTWLVKPALVRPVWLLPAAVGVICAAAVMTLSSGPPSRSRRRRS